MILSREVLLIIAVLLFISLTVFFITNFVSASNSVNVSVSDCQLLCQSLVTTAYNYDSCDSLMSNDDVIDYVTNCASDCVVSVRGGASCVLSNVNK